jgi:transcriptional regulator with XRE-family HTH domain
VTPGELLREVRRRHGLTQTHLAARAQTSRAAISRIERDLVSPSVATLTTLLDLIGEELILGAEPIDYGHDRELMRENLALSVEERISQGVFISNALLGRLPEPPNAGATLHAELVRVLVAEENRWMRTHELADRVNEAGRYLGGDATGVAPTDVDRRTRNYRAVFMRRGRSVRLRSRRRTTARG